MHLCRTYPIESLVDGTPLQIPAILSLTLGLHRILLNTLNIMIPTHMQSLRLLRPTILVEMYLQENKVFDLYLGINVT